MTELAPRMTELDATLTGLLRDIEPRDWDGCWTIIGALADDDLANCVTLL